MVTPYEKLLVSLVCGEVKFIVVGGVAVALNGFVRTTDDHGSGDSFRCKVACGVPCA